MDVLFTGENRQVSPARLTIKVEGQSVPPGTLELEEKWMEATIAQVRDVRLVSISDNLLLLSCLLEPSEISCSV